MTDDDHTCTTHHWLQSSFITCQRIKKHTTVSFMIELLLYCCCCCCRCYFCGYFFSITKSNHLFYLFIHSVHIDRDSVSFFLQPQNHFTVHLCWSSSAFALISSTGWKMKLLAQKCGHSARCSFFFLCMYVYVYVWVWMFSKFFTFLSLRSCWFFHIDNFNQFLGEKL